MESFSKKNSGESHVHSAAEDIGRAKDVVEVVEAMKRADMMDDCPTVIDVATIAIMATSRPMISSVAHVANKNISGGPHTVRKDEAAMTQNLMDTTHKAVIESTDEPKAMDKNMDKVDTEDRCPPCRARIPAARQPIQI